MNPHLEAQLLGVFIGLVIGLAIALWFARLGAK
jgi:hypothetical protein